MADDRAPKPAPRPRRRRTDIDPNAPTPPVANERRRRKKPAAAEAGEVAGGLDAASAAAAEAASILPDAPTAASPTAASPTGESSTGESSTAASPTGESSTGESSTAASQPTSETQSFRVPTFDDAPADRARTAVGAAGAVGAGAAERAAAEAAAATVVDTEGGPPTPDAPPAIDGGRAWLSRLEDRSLDPNICPFLRSSVDGKLASPIEQPDPTNRCAALSEAVPQSLRQQELVCLSSGHVNCPRYLRGAATATEAPVPVIRPRSTLTTPIFVSLVILVMTISASAAFVMARGGLVLSGDVASPSAVAVVSASPSVGASPSVAPSPSSSASPSPSLTPVPTPSASPSVTAAPTPAPTPTSDRYKLLKPCPNTPKCWIYTVRSGDNVYSIAHYFGVSTDSVYARNPWLKKTGLRAGQQLRLPPPTR